MDFAYSDKVNALRARVSDFMERYVYPNVQVFRDQVAASGNPHLDMLCLICGSIDTQDDERDNPHA